MLQCGLIYTNDFKMITSNHSSVSPSSWACYSKTLFTLWKPRLPFCLVLTCSKYPGCCRFDKTEKAHIPCLPFFPKFFTAQCIYMNYCWRIWRAHINKWMLKYGDSHLARMTSQSKRVLSRLSHCESPTSFHSATLMCTSLLQSRPPCSLLFDDFLFLNCLNFAKNRHIKGWHQIKYRW